MNNVCRTNSPQSVFFLSGTLGLEAWFVADFGDDFKYKCDPPNNKDVKCIAFPSLQSVFDRKWISMKSRFFDVSTTYVKSRILRTFIDQHGRCPGDGDLTAILALASELLKANGVDVDASFLDSLQLQTLPRIALAENVMVCSVLGSFLAQEVVKGVSLSGEPGRNVFVCSGHDCSVKAIPMHD